MSALSDPKAQQALLRSLADNLVENEVIKPMEQIDWTHGQPSPYKPDEDNPQEPVAPESKETVEPEVKTDNPTPAAEVKTDPSGETKTDSAEIDWEALRDPTTGLIMKKYKSPTDAVKGVRHAVNMAKQAFTERDTALKQLNEFGKAQPAQPVVPQTPDRTLVQETQISLKTEPVKSERLAKVLAKISEEGGLLDNDNSAELLDAFSEQSMMAADRIAERKLAERDKIINDQTEHWNEVAAKMETEYPDSIKFIDETALLIRATPRISRVVAALSSTGDDFGAAEFAWTEYEKVLNAQPIKETPNELAEKEMQLAVRDEVRQEEVEKARKEAGVFSSSAGGVHMSPETGPSKDEVADAIREMNATGLGVRWRALTIGKDLPDAVFAS